MGNIIFILQARLSIIDLLLIGLDKPAPSLSHFLLGFDLKKQASIGGQGSIARLAMSPSGFHLYGLYCYSSESDQSQHPVFGRYWFLSACPLGGIHK